MRAMPTRRIMRRLCSYRKSLTKEVAAALHTSGFVFICIHRFAGVLPWETPSLADYEALLSESEFAGWVLVNGYGLSHTAISVHRTGIKCN